MRRIFWAILFVLLVCSFLAWRLKPDTSEHGRTRLVWISDDNPVRREQIEIFNRSHPDILLTLDPGNIWMEKIIVQSIGGVGPDLFDAVGRYTIYGLVEAGVAMDLTDLAREHGFDLKRTWPAIAKELQIDGRQYSFPCNVVASVLFYNKALFDEYGVAYPPRDWTWDEFVDTASRLTRKARNRSGYECFGVAGLHWYELVLQAGGRMYSDDGTRCVLNSTKALKGIRFYYDLIHKYHIMPGPDDEALIRSEGGWGVGFLKWFGAGRVAMVRSGRAGLITLREYEALRGKIGAVHLPHDAEKAGLVYSRNCAVNRQSTNRDAAITFLEYLASDAYNTQIVRSADSLPPIPEYVDRDGFLHDPAHADEDFNDIFAEAMRRGVVPEISPLISPWVANKIMYDLIQDMSGNLRSPEETAEQMAFRVNRRIYQNLCKYQTFRDRYMTCTGKAFDAGDQQWKQYRQE